MHRQVSTILSDGGSPGQLARFGEALRRHGVNIDLIGGAEWDHRGPLSLTFGDKSKHDDDEVLPFATAMEEEHFGWLAYRSAEIELSDEPGELGRAGAVLGNANINIYGILVIGRHGKNGTVGLGIRPSKVEEAVTLLRAEGITAKRRGYPGEPDPWWDQWDDRTEAILDAIDANSINWSDDALWRADPFPSGG